MPVVIPRTPASAMSASSAHTSKLVLSSHEPRSSQSSSLHPASAQSQFHKPDARQPAPSTRRALHYNTPHSSTSPRSTPTTPATATPASDPVDLDSWQADTERQLERLIVSAELVLSQEKQRVRLGLSGGGGLGTADSFEQLDDADQHEVLDLLAQAKRLQYGAGKELHDIQRSVAEEKENVTGGGSAAAAQDSGSAVTAQSGSTAEHVRRMSELIELLEARVEDLQADIDQHKPALAQLNAERSAKQQLTVQLATQQQQYDQAEQQLQQLRQQQRSQQQQAAQLAQRLADVSGQCDEGEALLAAEKVRADQWLREAGEARADLRRLEDEVLLLAGRESAIRDECERRLARYDRVRRESVRVKMLGVLCVGLAVLWAGVEPWMNEYVRSDPRLYTF